MATRNLAPGARDGSGVTEDSLFNIGSCSKAFVAASLGILIEESARGRNTTPLPTGLSTLSWQTDILPGDWELSDPWASKKANLIDILTQARPRFSLQADSQHIERHPLEIELMASPGGLLSSVKEFGILGEIISEQRGRFTHQRDYHPTRNPRDNDLCSQHCLRNTTELSGATG